MFLVLTYWNNLYTWCHNKKWLVLYYIIKLKQQWEAISEFSFLFKAVNLPIREVCLIIYIFFKICLGTSVIVFFSVLIWSLINVCPWHTVILYRPSDVPFLNASLSLWLEIPYKGKNMVQIWLWKIKFVFFQTHHLERTKGKIEQSTRFTDDMLTKLW